MSHPMTQLTPNLWISQSKFANTNSGIIHAGEDICLIDPGILPSEIKVLTEFVELKDVTSKILILTHSHWDHLFGPEQFPGYKVIAQANYPEGIQGEAGRQILKNVERLTSHFEIERQKPFVIPQPDETFEETLTLLVGNLSLQLVHAPGHTADQLVIYLPEDGILWAGDMLGDAEIPFVNYSLAAYEKTLDKLAELEISVLAPGHGAPTSDGTEIQNRIKADRAYLTVLREQVSQAVDAELSVTETVESCKGFHHHSLEENGDAHRLNIESVYMELGGVADSTKVGWHQIFE